MRGLAAVCIASGSERTLPVGRVDGNRGDLYEDLVLANSGNGTFFCLDSCVRLDNDCSVGLWDLEVGHIERGWKRMWLTTFYPVRSLDLYTPHSTLNPFVRNAIITKELLTKQSQVVLTGRIRTRATGQNHESSRSCEKYDSGFSHGVQPSDLLYDLPTKDVDGRASCGSAMEVSMERRSEVSRRSGPRLSYLIATNLT